jgi:iron complex transport system ATP-binding protein
MTIAGKSKIENKKAPTVPILAASNVTLKFGATTVLDAVSFTIEAGAFVAVIGPNGAGKSCLLRCLDRLHDYSGTVSYDGHDINNMSRRELARVMSYLPQVVETEIQFSVVEFLAMSRYPWRDMVSQPHADDVIRDAMERTDIAKFANRQVSTLSGGERQRVLLTADLVQDADVMLLDEVTTALDPRHQDDISDLLAAPRKTAAKTVVIVTHDINRALDADRIIAMKAGKIVTVATPAEILESRMLDELFERQFHIVTHPGNGKTMVL